MSEDIIVKELVLFNLENQQIYTKKVPKTGIQERSKLEFQ
jgi:hypothetical protein